MTSPDDPRRDDQPLELSDKFVTPEDAVQWLDPSKFPPVGEYEPPVQFGNGDENE